MGARLFVIPASHPAAAVELMLRRKGVDYSRVDLMPAISKVVVRAMGFPGTSVPALRIDGQRLQGSREISRGLERLRPEPPLFPADPELRERVEEAERWGDERLQHPLRQLAWWALRRRPGQLGSYAEGARLGLPIGLAVRTAAPILALQTRFHDAGDDTVRSVLSALPSMLDRIDGWIADGTLGGEEPNAADFQIAPSVALALTFDDLRPAIEGRPAAELARRYAPDYPGRMVPVIPPAWLAPLRGG